MEIKEAFLKDIFAQKIEDEKKKKKDEKEYEKVTFDQDCKMLLAGLAILAKDLAEYININAYASKGVDSFQKIYTETLNTDRFFWEIQDDNLFKTLKDAKLPAGFSKEAANAKFTLTELKKPAVADKFWVTYPGWAMLKLYKEKLKPQLCGPNAPFEQYEVEDSKNKKELAMTTAIFLLEREFSSHTFWYPFVVYLSILLVKTGKEPYCET